MTVEIWSDIMCPFCYIGKRRFENALLQFAQKDKVEIVWRSFQLDPDIKNGEKANLNEYLAKRKGWSVEYAQEMNQHVTEMAKESGLQYNLNQAVVANSFDAHRLIHLAAQHGLQDQAEERLFSAYFCEGKNVGDHDTLVQLGVEMGIDSSEIKNMLASDGLIDDVVEDIHIARDFRITGVPFFVIDRNYGISGAQPSPVFLSALQKAWNETAVAIEASSSSANECAIDGNC